MATQATPERPPESAWPCVPPLDSQKPRMFPWNQSIPKMLPAFQPASGCKLKFGRNWAAICTHLNCNLLENWECRKCRMRGCFSFWIEANISNKNSLEHLAVNHQVTTLTCHSFLSTTKWPGRIQSFSRKPSPSEPHIAVYWRLEQTVWPHLVLTISEAGKGCSHQSPSPSSSCWSNPQTVSWKT